MAIDESDTASPTLTVKPKVKNAFPEIAALEVDAQPFPPQPPMVALPLVVTPEPCVRPSELVTPGATRLALNGSFPKFVGWALSQPKSGRERMTELTVKSADAVVVLLKLSAATA